MVKRENVQKMDPKIRVLNNAEIVVSPQCHTHFYRNMWIYEHGFRSAGMFMMIHINTCYSNDSDSDEAGFVFVVGDDG